jgi:hypothetical protein
MFPRFAFFDGEAGDQTFCAVPTSIDPVREYEMQGKFVISLPVPVLNQSKYLSSE